MNCAKVGLCRLPLGHAGLCVYAPQPASLGLGPVGVADEDGRVVLDFGAPGTWRAILFEPEAAAALGVKLIARARALQVAAGASLDGGREVH